jgi:hypothetical protein
MIQGKLRVDRIERPTTEDDSTAEMEMKMELEEGRWFTFAGETM